MTTQYPYKEGHMGISPICLPRRRGTFITCGPQDDDNNPSCVGSGGGTSANNAAQQQNHPFGQFGADGTVEPPKLPEVPVQAPAE